MLEQIKKARKAEREKGRRQGDKETNYRKEFRSKCDDDLVQEMV
jgi:hypothetical protein